MYKWGTIVLKVAKAWQNPFRSYSRLFGRSGAVAPAKIRTEDFWTWCWVLETGSFEADTELDAAARRRSVDRTFQKVSEPARSPSPAFPVAGPSRKLAPPATKP
jgi:hypothetical protein